jgi:hypothetical protein
VGLFIYYLFIFNRLAHFLLLTRGGWHGFYFSPFLLFLVLCVMLLLSVFTLAKGRGCEFIFHFKIIIIYIFNKFFITFFTF